MPLSGGSTDKFGNRFEGRWTTVCMTEVLNETACSIRLEPPGIVGEGIEFWLRRIDNLEFHQVKRQTSSSGYWTIAKLSSEKVLQNFYNKIIANERSTCVFISTQDVYILSEMVSRARGASSFEEFTTEFIDSQKYSKHFDEICQIWSDCSEKTAFDVLRRIYIRCIDEDTLKNNIVINSVAPLVEGNPATIADVLAQFALDETNKELNASDIWNHLRERGFKHRKWNRDPLVLAAIEDCTERSLPKLQESTILGKAIQRGETQIILDKFKTIEEKRALLISGEAGVGKSGVLLQVAESLRKQGKPLLALRVDRLDPTPLPDEVGKNLGLPASPANVLKAIAQGHECFLIIDQLDAVSETSGRNPWFFDCIFEIINQALNYPEMRILLACRKFDLENDPRLRSLIGKQAIAEKVSINRLSHDTIKQFIKNELSLDIQRLNFKQLDLLSIPLHLSLLAEISQDHEIDAIDFETTKDLYDRFWDRKGRLLRQRLPNSSHWTEVVFALADYMSDHQTLSAPVSILDGFADLPDAMSSEHILVKDGNRYAFFHQGFFDYVFARNFCTQGYELVPFLKSDTQHLFRRAQVRQILLQERDDNFTHYIASLESLLNDPIIRFHLKKIVFALLAELSDPKIDEWKILSTFLNNSADPRSKEVKYILFKSVPWIKLLNSEGQMKKWLADTNKDNIDLSIILLSAIQKYEPETVTDLIAPYIDKSEIWDQRLSQIIKVSKINASKSFFKLVLHLMDKGTLDKVEGLNPFAGYFWHAQDSLTKNNPAWACEFLGHYLNRKLIVSLSAGQPNPFDREKGCIPDHVRDDEIINSIKECSERSPETFIYELLPFILKVIGFTAYRDDETGKSTWYDLVWQFRYYYDRFGFYIYESVLSLMEVAMALLAKNKPNDFKNIGEFLGDLEFETVHFLLIRAYSANGKEFAQEAVNYISKFPICFETGYYEDRYRAAKELLEAITPYCSEDQLSHIMIDILKYFPDKRNIRYRIAQFILLGSISLASRPESVVRYLDMLEYEFGKLPKEPPRYFICGTVKSPISEEEAQEMSDEEWLKAISLYDSDDRPFSTMDNAFVGGASQLSYILEKQVNKYPLRFAAIIKKVPEDSNIHYFNAILRGIKDSDLDTKLKLDVCKWCHNLKNRPCGMQICDVISKIADNDLPNEALDIVAWYATKDSDPEKEIWRISSANGTPYYGGDILNAGLNSVRGRAAEALAHLVFYKKDRISYLEPVIETMVKDPLIEVRSWVALILISVLRHDRDLAVMLLQQLCDTEDLLLSTYHVECFLNYALHTHFSTLKPILERMISSHESEVVKAGSRQICLISFELEDALPLMESCLGGTEDQRFSVSEVFSANLRVKPDFCKENLIRLFSDPSEHVRIKASSCFRHLVGGDLGGFADLIEAFIESPAFDSDKGDLFWALEKTTAKLPEITYKACKKGFESINHDHRSSIEIDIAQLILRVYSQNKDNSLGNKCLDVIDAMIEKGVYRIDNELLNFDR